MPVKYDVIDMVDIEIIIVVNKIRNIFIIYMYLPKIFKNKISF